MAWLPVCPTGAGASRRLSMLDDCLDHPRLVHVSIKSIVEPRTSRYRCCLIVTAAALVLQVKQSIPPLSAWTVINELNDLLLSLQYRLFQSSAVRQTYLFARYLCAPSALEVLNDHVGWLRSRVVSVLDSGAVEPGFKSQPRRCRVTVLGKLFTPKQRNW